MISKPLQDTLTAWAEELSEQGHVLSEQNSLKAPQWMAARARQGLALRDKQSPSNKCCTLVGLNRANQLANGESLSLSVWKRMRNFALRNGSNIGDENSKSRQAALCWGYDKGEKDKFISACERAIAKLEAQ